MGLGGISAACISVVSITFKPTPKMSGCLIATFSQRKDFIHERSGT
jgi:hypothetical protein